MSKFLIFFKEQLNIIDNNISYVKHKTQNMFLTVVTMFLFMIGLILGEIQTDIQSISLLTGVFATIFSFVVGSKVLYTAYKINDLIVVITMLFIWISNFSYTFSILDQPKTDILYDFATILVIIVLYRTENYDRKILHDKEDQCMKCGANRRINFDQRKIYNEDSVL